MNYNLVLTDEAEKQLLLWKKSGQKKYLFKILSLFKELEEHPATGTGQVEALKGNLSGYWSRRINKHFRIIYTIHEDIVTIEVISIKSHYDNI
ncbi:Txe/YoeB family addiction module toxin [Parabacteroides provencensis]|uniref:Txe/YoeB family addiction module toxin n=1 Tax=Parabacteroides provencensis TaxID=1944636 RepID=UPI000C15EE88|nr:Txe/YoeB family addiction module toxin [Parabacteroides provencensis]